MGLLQHQWLAALFRLARDRQGSERARGHGRSCHHASGRPGDGAAAPFHCDSEEVKRVDSRLQTPPLTAVSACRRVHAGGK